MVGCVQEKEGGCSRRVRVKGGIEWKVMKLNDGGTLPGLYDGNERFESRGC